MEHRARRTALGITIALVATLAVHAETGLSPDLPVIDLSAYDFTARPLAPLSGEWLGYWRRLLAPDDLERPAAPPGDGPFLMPGTWNDWHVDGRPVGRFGHATFAVRVVVPPEMDTVALRVPNASTAYRLWGNGEVLAESGVPGSSANTTTPRYRMLSAQVPVPDGELVLVLHVANYHHRRGGMWKPIELGAVDAVNAKQTLETIYDLLLIGSFAAMALYNLLLALTRRGARTAPLLLSALFMTLVFRIPMMGQMIITQVFPEFPWSVQLRVEYLTAQLSLLTFTWILRVIYPSLFSRRFSLGVSGFVAVNAGVLLIGSVYFYSLIVSYFVYSMIALLFYETARLVIAVVRGHRAAWYGIGAAAITFFITLGETIHYNEVILARDFAPFGFLITLVAGDSINTTTTYMVSAGINLALLFIVANLLVLRGSHALSIVAVQAVPSASTSGGRDAASERDRLVAFRERHGITAREGEVIRLMAEGKSNKEIAAVLYVSEATIKTHVHRILRKTGLGNRTEVGRAYFDGFPAADDRAEA